MSIFTFALVWRDVSKRHRDTERGLAKLRAIREAREADRRRAMESAREEKREERLRRSEVQARQAEAQTRRQTLLLTMTDDELQAVWRARPLVSWSGEMAVLDADEQFELWKRNLQWTFWEIPPNVVAAVQSRNGGA